MRHFRFSNDAIDAASETQATHNPAAGGFASFEGWVRNLNEGRTVARLNYEAFEALAVIEGEKIIAEAIKRFGILTAHCVHRVGELAIGDIAVWVGASAPHRAEAFAACRYIIDEVKHRVPIWKKEFYTDGDSGWVNCERCAQPTSASDHSHQSHGHSHPHPHAAHPTHHPEPTAEAVVPAANYSRQIVLKDIGEAGQRKIRSARVLLVGAGGLGVPAALYLAGAGVGVLGVIDPDVIDASNLHRQPIYTQGTLGQSKALVLKQHLNQLNSEVDVRAYVARADFKQLHELASGYDMVLDCSDNFTTRFVVNDVAKALGIPAVVASVYQYEGQIQVLTPSGACLRCLWPEATRDGLVGNCQEAGVLGPVPGVLGALQALEAIKLVVGMRSPLTSHLALIDLLSFETRRLKISKHPDCDATHSAPARGDQPILEVLSLDDAIAQSLVVIDLRNPDERHAHPLTVAHRALWSAEILANPSLLDAAAGAVLVCAKGVRSRALAQELTGRGVKNVYSLKGGLG